MPLSMLQAFNERQNGTISWDEYIRIHLLRATGVKSNEDNAENTYSKLRDTDPFGHMMGHWVDRLVDRLGHIEDISPFEDVFKAYRLGTLEDVKDKLTPLQRLSPMAFEGSKQTLGMLACQERRADVLKYCLEGGFPIESTFLEEAESVDAVKDPETYDVFARDPDIQQIWEIERIGRERREKQQREGTQQGRQWGPDENGTWAGRTQGAPWGVEAVFDRGGKLPVDW